MDSLERYRDIVPNFEAFRAIQCLPLCNSVRINTLKIEKITAFGAAGKSRHRLPGFRLVSSGPKAGCREPGKDCKTIFWATSTYRKSCLWFRLSCWIHYLASLILDLCASPGSKTTQISQMMNNRGLVIANEPSLARVAPLRSNCERLGVLNVAITRYDGRNFPRGPFDRVLVDAPCSSEGRERKGPGVLARSSSKKSIDLQALQIGLLKNALRLVKPGGIVVYSTCTYAPEENELVVQTCLDVARLEKISIPGLKECPGVTEWNGEPLDNNLMHCARYYPHLNDAGGFFVAKFIKN